MLLHYMYLKAQSTFMNPLQCVLKLTLDTGELNFSPVQGEAPDGVNEIFLVWRWLADFTRGLCDLAWY